MDIKVFLSHIWRGHIAPETACRILDKKFIYNIDRNDLVDILMEVSHRITSVEGVLKEVDFKAKNKKPLMCLCQN